MNVWLIRAYMPISYLNNQLLLIRHKFIKYHEKIMIRRNRKKYFQL